MKSEFRNAADVAEALADLDMVDVVVRRLAGNDKDVLSALNELVDIHNIADASVLKPDDRMELALAFWERASFVSASKGYAQVRASMEELHRHIGMAI